MSAVDDDPSAEEAVRRQAIALYACVWSQLANNFYSPAAALTLAIVPLSIAGISALIYQESGAQQFAAYAVLGPVVYSIWNHSFFITLIFMKIGRDTGTLEVELTSPASLWVATLGRSIANSISGLPGAVLGATLASVILGTPDVFVSPLGVVAALGASIACCTAFAALLSPLTLLVKQVDGTLAVAAGAGAMLTGVMYPLAALPTWLQWLSAILPTRWSAEALVEAGTGGINGDYLVAIGALLAITSASLLFAGPLMAVLETRIRRTGSHI